MKLLSSAIVFLLFFAFCLADAQFVGHKISANLIETFEENHTNTISFFVLLEKATFSFLSDSNATKREEEHRKFIVYLEEHARKQQQQVFLPFLRSLNVSIHQKFWITNAILIEANYTTAKIIAGHTLVQRLEPNEILILPLVMDSDHAIKQILSIPWHLDWTEVPRVWELGFMGEEIVVAGADTGIQWDHPALVNQYRGYDSETGQINHNYNWWDAVHRNHKPNRCGHDSKEPCDDRGHGTHTIGSVVGDDRMSQQIGVAPRAKWIGCRNMDSGLGSTAQFVECFQFLIAPTDLNGENPQPSMRPHVITNSYGCPDGCEDLQLLHDVVSNIISAGIFMTAATGNTGPECGTIDTPPAIYSESLTVGAGDYKENVLARFSSRGPAIGNTGVLKPDVIAPGTNILSSYPDNSYRSFSGSSMASPQVAGVVALISQANPQITRNVEELQRIIKNSTTQIENSDCSSPISFPNFLYGYGMVNALDSIRTAICYLPQEALSKESSLFPSSHKLSSSDDNLESNSFLIPDFYISKVEQDSNNSVTSETTRTQEVHKISCILFLLFISL